MHEYWHMISDEHQQKLITIAERKSVSLDTAMRNIVNFLKQEQNNHLAVPEYFRELENTVEHAFVLCSEPYIDIFDLPVEIRQLEYRPGLLEVPSSATANSFRRRKIFGEMLVEIMKE